MTIRVVFDDEGIGLAVARPIEVTGRLANYVDVPVVVRADAGSRVHAIGSESIDHACASERDTASVHSLRSGAELVGESAEDAVGVPTRSESGVGPLARGVDADVVSA